MKKTSKVIVSYKNGGISRIKLNEPNTYNFICLFCIFLSPFFKLEVISKFLSIEYILTISYNLYPF